MQNTSTLFRTLCSRLSKLIGMSKSTKKIWPLESKKIRLNGVSAIFFELDIKQQITPLQIMLKKDIFKDYKGSMNYEVYWSYTNQYPSREDPDIQGAFSDQQLMRIHPHGVSKFAGESLYIGIYCLNSLYGSIAYSFGNQSLKKLNLCFR